MDRAPCHRAGKESLYIPDNIKLLFQPPYSPEVNPVEHIWDKMREKFFGNCVFKDMKAVKKHLVKSLLHIESHSEQIKSLTLFPWIEKALNR